MSASDKLIEDEGPKKKRKVDLHLGISGDSNTEDQTPTPTRFIRNCEEVGLFQDLQNVNPFDETFRQAAHGSLHLPPVTSNEESLHTPHIFPHIPQDKFTNSENNFAVDDDILVINEGEINRSSPFSFNTQGEMADSATNLKKGPSLTSENGEKSECPARLREQREINRAAQVRSRARKKLMLHKLIEEVSQLKSKTTELAKQNEKLQKEVVWLKTVLGYHKDCPVSKDPRIMEEIKNAADENLRHPGAKMLVPFNPNQSSPLVTAVVMQVPTIPGAQKLAPLLPKLTPPMSVIPVQTPQRNERRGRKWVKLKHINDLMQSSSTNT